jgi:hypothetical protein
MIHRVFGIFIPSAYYVLYFIENMFEKHEAVQLIGEIITLLYLYLTIHYLSRMHPLANNGAHKPI